MCKKCKQQKYSLRFQRVRLLLIGNMLYCSLIISANILNHFPGMDLAILDLVAPNFGAPLPCVESCPSLTVDELLDGNSYWRHDIDRVLKTMAAYDARIIGGDEAAAAESAKYKEGRIQIVKDMRQVDGQNHCHETEQILTL